MLIFSFQTDFPCWAQEVASQGRWISLKSFEIEAGIHAVINKIIVNVQKIVNKTNKIIFLILLG